MDKHIYLISGMGADERIFKNLRFPEGYVTHFLQWLPTIPGESFTDYAARMSTGIEHENITLLGVSFGGMLSLEIARQLNVGRVVLISSLKNTNEKPIYFRWVKKMGLLRLLGVPDSIIKHRKYFLQPFLHAESREERDILRDYMQKTSFEYMRWALPVVINWENEFIPNSLIHIHGSKDFTLPIRHVKPTHTIPTGGHLMVFNRAAEINEILNKELS